MGWTTSDNGWSWVCKNFRTGFVSSGINYCLNCAYPEASHIVRKSYVAATEPLDGSYPPEWPEGLD